MINIKYNLSKNKTLFHKINYINKNKYRSMTRTLQYFKA